MRFTRRKMPGNIYGFGIGKALGYKGKTHWGIFINWGRWNIRWETVGIKFPSHPWPHNYQRKEGMKG